MKKRQGTKRRYTHDNCLYKGVAQETARSPETPAAPSTQKQPLFTHADVWRIGPRQTQIFLRAAETALAALDEMAVVEAVRSWLAGAALGRQHVDAQRLRAARIYLEDAARRHYDLPNAIADIRATAGSGPDDAPCREPRDRAGRVLLEAIEQAQHGRDTALLERAVADLRAALAALEG